MLTGTVNGHVIRVIRERKGMRVADVVAALAEQGVHVTERTLYFYETGGRQPSAKKVTALAQVLGCSRDELVTEHAA